MYMCVCVGSKLDLLSSDTFKNQINGNDQLFKINTIIRSIITIQFSGHKKI